MEVWHCEHFHIELLRSREKTLDKKKKKKREKMQLTAGPKKLRLAQISRRPFLLQCSGQYLPYSCHLILTESEWFTPQMTIKDNVETSGTIWDHLRPSQTISYHFGSSPYSVSPHIQMSIHVLLWSWLIKFANTGVYAAFGRWIPALTSSFVPFPREI